MLFKTWRPKSNSMVLLRQMKHSLLSLTREIILKAKTSLCLVKHIREAILHTLEDYLTKRYVFPCAVNRNGLSISKITNTGRVSTKDLHHIYDGRIDENSTLVTDKMNSYVRFTKANGIDLVQLKTGKSKKGIYIIQHINSYHSQLKKFMRSFNGVSTKYLNNYLTWNNLINYAKETDTEKKNIFFSFVLATLKTSKCRDLSSRPAIPLAV
jgi:hypothetical protein